MIIRIFFTLYCVGYLFPAQAIEEGEQAPLCTSPIMSSSKTLDLTQYRNKVVLVDFWATWCPPCLKSMPFFNQLHNELASKGFEVIAINVDEESDEAKQFLSKHPVDYPVAFDPAGDCPALYDVKAMPSSYLLDKAGVVHAIHLGYRDEDRAEITQQITELLKK